MNFHPTRLKIKKLSILLFSLMFFNSCDDSENKIIFGSNELLQQPEVTCGDINYNQGFHVTTSGTPEGDGSIEHPWDLETALNHPAVVMPGDTIWVHDGTYTGTFSAKLDGEENNPVTVSAVFGDRVILDSEGSDEPVLQIYHSWTVFRGIEITNTSTQRRQSRATGIYMGGDHIFLHNMIVHDVGVGISGGQLSDNIQEGTNLELYGSIFYNNGWLETDRGHGHHLYLTNRDGAFTIAENILFSAYGFGVHNYSETDRNYVQNYNIIGNIWFLNGAPGKKLVDGCLVGHNGSLPVSSLLLKENFSWNPSVEDRSIRLGWGAPVNNDVQLIDNFISGQTIFQQEWRAVAMTGNTFIGNVSGVLTTDFPDNNYFSETPSQNAVFIRKNRYQPGRFHVIVYNFEDLPLVSVDFSDILVSGTHFVLKNVRDYFGAPVLEGTYEGITIDIPMENLSWAPPIGETEEIEWSTGKSFGVFILEADVCN